MRTFFLSLHANHPFPHDSDETIEAPSLLIAVQRYLAQYPDATELSVESMNTPA